MINESCAHRMAGDHRSLESEHVECFAQMLDQTINRVFIARLRLVGQAMPLEIRRDRAKSGGGERGQIVSKGVGGAAPAVHQQHRRRFRVSSFYNPNSES